jgi:hypothetical protein
MRIAPHRTSPFRALLLEPNEANAVELASRHILRRRSPRSWMIVATCNCDADACDVIHRHGGDACLSLPIDLDDLIARLNAFQLRARPSF